MESYLYQDLYELEDSHWWHKAKRNICKKMILQYYCGKDKPKILDIGCGTGKNIEAFSKIGDTWGVDNSKEALYFCKKRNIHNIQLGSADTIPFPADFFDVVTALDVLEHTDDKKTMKEIVRILKVGGILVATVPALPLLWSRWDEVLHHKRRYTRASLGSLVQGEDLKLEKLSYMYSFLVLPVILIRFIKSTMCKEEYVSDFKLSTPVINTLMLGISRLESYCIVHWHVPIGTSLLVVAKKFHS